MPLIDVTMPQMGESLTEGTVVAWLKSPGDRVARDEALFEITTDKVDTEVPSPIAGTLAEVLVDVGQTVAVGVIVARVEADAPAQASATAPAAAAPAASASESASGGHFKSSHAPQLVSFGHRQPSTPARTSAPVPMPAAPSMPAHAALVQTAPVRAVPASPVAAQGAAPAAQVPAFAPAGGAAPAAAPVNRTYTATVLDTARRGGLSLQTLTGMQGSGRGGRVTKRDVERFLQESAAMPPAGGGGRVFVQPPAAAAAAPAAAAVAAEAGVPAEFLYRPAEGDRVVEMSPVRRRIARHMSWSARISPHASAFADCDMTRAVDIVRRQRERFAARVGAPLTYTVLAAEAVVRTLREFPIFNASVVDDTLIMKPRVHLGIAVALADTDDLIVPVIRDADGLSIEGLARAVADVATRARARSLRVEDVQGGTFTLTNPGIFGGLTGTPILNQPQVGIVGLGAIGRRAVVLDEDRIAARSMMTVSLTFDHRAADGMAAFRFLGRLKERLEHGPDELTD